MQNLLLITFDQWRGDWADPCHPVVHLPTLSTMATLGTHYKRCYTSSPQCVPARLSWLSGKMPSIFGITRNESCTVRKDIPSIFKKLKRKGYHTQIIGKTHWTSHTANKDLRENNVLYNELGIDYVNDIGGPRALRNVKCELTEKWIENNVMEEYIEDLNYRYRQKQGRNAWHSKPTVLPDELYPDIWIAKKGSEAVRKLPNDKPWFLWISFVGPHEPFDTPETWRRKDLKDNLPKQISRKDWISQLNPTTELFKANEKWKNSFSQQEAIDFREDYADNLRLLDSLLGKICIELQNRDDHQNAKTIITSDHGEMLGDYGMLYKSTFLEPAIRVPMLIIDGKGNNQTKKLVQTPVTSTEIIKESIKRLVKQNVDRNPCAKRVVIEYGKERCFIHNNLKLVTSQDNKILWMTKILKDGTKEKRIRIGSTQWQKNSKQWINLMKWAENKNIQLNKDQDSLAHCIEKEID